MAEEKEVKENKENSVFLNGQEISFKDFLIFKEALDKNTRLVENGPNNYITRLLD